MPAPTVIAAELELARFLASQPSTEDIIAFHPASEVTDRYYSLLELAKDYERKVQTSETLIELAATRLLLRRLAI